MTRETELLPCECGCTKVVIVRTGKNQTYVKCRLCGLSGCIAAWNTRAK